MSVCRGNSQFYLSRNLINISFSDRQKQTQAHSGKTAERERIKTHKTNSGRSSIFCWLLMNFWLWYIGNIDYYSTAADMIKSCNILTRFPWIQTCPFPISLPDNSIHWLSELSPLGDHTTILQINEISATILSICVNLGFSLLPGIMIAVCYEGNLKLMIN